MTQIKDKKISESTIYQSIDYDKFKLLDENRPVRPNHVLNLIKSFKKKRLKESIIVNKNFEILDGQHRVEVCKTLGIPIFYEIKEDYEVEDIIKINTQAGWTLKNFINFYAKRGNEHYKALILFMEVHKEIKCVNIYLDLLVSGNYNENNLKGESLIKEGSFEIKDLQKAHETADQMMEFKILKDFNNSCWGQYLFFKALLKAFRHPDYKQEWFIKNIKLNPLGIVRAGKVHDYLRLFSEVYNKNIKSSSNVKAIAFEYGKY